MELPGHGHATKANYHFLDALEPMTFDGVMGHGLGLAHFNGQVGHGVDTPRIRCNVKLHYT